METRIVVTGGNSGIGRQAVEKFLEQGDKVVFTSRTTGLAQEMLHDLQAYAEKGCLYFFQGDVGKLEDVLALVAFTKDQIGGCDVLVNNAAVFAGGEVHEVSEDDFDALMNVNVKGVFMTSKYFLPEMLERKSGTIINISSLAGKRGGYNMPVYCATKAAVNNLTRCMAIDYMSKGIRVNAVCPSATKTKMFTTGTSQKVFDAYSNSNPSKRIGEPSEVADLILFLASDKANYINGECISVDGGLHAWNGEWRQDRTE